MFYHKYQPCATLQSFVECYFIWDSEGPLENCMTVESPPSGYCSIVFNYGDPYYLHNKKYEKLQVPLCFISGQSIYSYQLLLQGVVGMAGIVFKPAALATLFHLPMYEYVEERVDLCKIFKKELVEQCALRIRQGSDEQEKIKWLEDFVLSQVEKQPPEPDYIDIAANFIVENNGMVQVKDLLKESCMSRRTFERKFFRKVGLSPKYYARVRRIGYLCNLIAGMKKADWARLFYDCNFFDQAHFIKDFEAFTGRTPQQYLKENTELAKYVAKPTLNKH